MKKRIKKLLSLAFLVLFTAGALYGCDQPNMQPVGEPFPYEDLTEEAYIKNAEDYWEELELYLDTTDEEELEHALKAFYDEKGGTTQETIMASEMLLLFQEYLLETSGETLESIDAMGEEERAEFRKKNQQKIEEEIPNAWKVQQDSMQKENDDQGIIGTYTFKDQKQMTAYKDGTFLSVPIN